MTARRRDASELRAAREQERQFARGIKRPRKRPGLRDLARPDAERKDDAFRQLSELSGSIVAQHGRDFTVGALLLAARYVAKYAPDSMAAGAPADRPAGGGDAGASPLAAGSALGADVGERRIVIPGERPQ